MEQSEPVITETERRPTDQIASRFAKAAMWSTFGGIIGRLLQGIAPLALARVLGPSEYGVYALAYSLVGVLTMVSSLGQNSGLQKFLPEYSEKDPARGGAILVNTVVIVLGAIALVSVGLLLVSHWISVRIYHDPGLSPVFKWCCLLVCSLTLFNVSTSVTAGLQEFRDFSIGVIVRSAAFLILGVIGAILWGVIGAIAGQVIASLIGFSIVGARALRSARQRFPLTLRFNLSRDVLLEILHFLLPALLSGLIVLPAIWWSNTLVAQVGGFEALGQYGFAYALGQVVLLVPMSLSAPAISFFSEAYATQGPDRMRTLVTSNLRLIWTLTLPLTVLFSLAIGPAVVLLLGRSYMPALRLVPWMCFASLFIVLGTQIGLAIASLGRMWEGLALNVLWLVVFVTLVHAVVWRHGAFGVAVAYAVSYLVFSVFLWQYSSRFLAIQYSRFVPLVFLTFLTLGISVIAISYLAGPWACLLAVILSFGLAFIEWQLVLDVNERSQVRRHLQTIRALAGSRFALTMKLP